MKWINSILLIAQVRKLLPNVILHLTGIAGNTTQDSLTHVPCSNQYAKPAPFVDLLPLLWFFSRRSSSSNLETDDEPPCGEEIDYNTDSCSDEEGDFSELDKEIQEGSPRAEGETEEEGTSEGQTCSSKVLKGLYISSQPTSNKKALPLPPASLRVYTGFESSPAWVALWFPEQWANGSLLTFPVCQFQLRPQMRCPSYAWKTDFTFV